MRGTQYAWAILVLSVPLLVVAQLGDLSVPSQLLDKPAEHKGELRAEKAAKNLGLPTLLRRVTSTTTTLDVDNSPAGTVSFNISSSPKPTSVATPTNNISNPIGAINSVSSSTSPADAGSSSTRETDDKMPTRERNLIIILTTTLGSAAIILIAVVITLTCRYKSGKSPFNSRRGVTPIDDEEIDSWREQKLSPALGATSPHTPRGLSIDSIALKQSPQWTWNSSPGGFPTQPALVHNPSKTDFIARAPNSRVGLTDEAIPGAEPFVTPPKRQSSRLSKSPRHARTKSRRSSMSGKSMRSFTTAPPAEPKSPRAPTWYDPEDESVAAGLGEVYSNNSTPGTSIFDGLSVVGGGLSPRPKSKAQLRPWEPDYSWDKETGNIGRAIA